ncbi:unnamed protein product [Rhodiola kirilowii]
MESARFRFRDHVENGEQFESETSSDMSSVVSDGGEDSEPESMTGKGIKRLCAELLELKSASDEEFHKNVYADYSAFLRIFEEARGMESELTQLRNNLVAEKRLVENLADGVYLKVLSEETIEGIIEAEFDEGQSLVSKLEAHTDDVLEILDTLLSEQRLEEALAVLEMEEVAVHKIQSKDEPDMDVLAFYNYSVSGRKGMLAKKFSVLAENPRVNGPELQRALTGLCRLGERQLATQLLLRHYHLRMTKGIHRLQSLKSHLNDLYVKELSKSVFSIISQAAKCFIAVHGESSRYPSELIEWAHEETAVFAACFNIYVESISETGGGLSIATESVHVAMIFCSLLESQRLVLQPCMMKHIRPALEKVLKAQIRHFKRVIGIFTSCDTWDLSRYLISGILKEGFPLASTGEELEYCLLTSSGRKLITLLQAVIEEGYPLFTLEMGSFIIEGLMNLIVEYISILKGALTMRSSTDVLDSGGSIDNIPESVLQQVSILLNISAVQHFFSSFLASLIHNTGSSNVKTATSYTVDCQEQQLDEYIVRVKETSGRLRCQFYQRFIDLPMSAENNRLIITGSSIDEAYMATVNHYLPTLKFQFLFLELRKLEDFSEENAIEDGWLMELLADLIEAVFVSMSDDKDRWMAVREDAELQDVGNYKQLVLDIQFMVEIARFEGCLSDDLLIASSTLVSQLEAAGMGPDRELSNCQWAAWARNSATKSIQMLLEIHMAKSASDEHEMPSPEESQNEGSCLDDDMSSLSEKSDELEENLEMGVEQEVVISPRQLSLTRPSIMVDDGSLNVPPIHHSEIEAI